MNRNIMLQARTYEDAVAMLEALACRTCGGRGICESTGPIVGRDYWPCDACGRTGFDNDPE